MPLAGLSLGGDHYVSSGLSRQQSLSERAEKRRGKDERREREAVREGASVNVVSVMLHLVRCRRKSIDLRLPTCPMNSDIFEKYYRTKDK